MIDDSPMQRFILEFNIRQFRSQLEVETSDVRQQRLRSLLAEQEAALVALQAGAPDASA